MMLQAATEESNKELKEASEHHDLEGVLRELNGVNKWNLKLRIWNLKLKICDLNQRVSNLTLASYPT